MRINYLFVLVAFCLIAVTANAQKTIPDVNVKTLDGQSVSIQDCIEPGKIIVISFWATWCSPCKKELDAIVDLYPDWQEQYDVEFLAITIDTRRALAKVKPLVATKGWEYTILSDANSELKNALNFQTIPQTFLIDRNGHVVYEHNGYAPGDEYELEDKIKALAGK